MLKVRFACLLLIALLSVKPVKAITCSDLLKEPTQKSRFESGAFEPPFIALKEEFISQIRAHKTIDEALWQKPDSKLAFLQAVGETSNWDILNIQAIAEQRESALFKKVNHLVSQMEFEKGVGKYQFQNQLTQLYTLLNPAPQLLFTSPSKNVEKMMEQQIEKAFLEKSLEKAVFHLGLVKSGRDISKFKEFRHKHRKFERAAISTFINVVTLDVVGGVTDLTSVLRVKKKIPDEFIERIYTEGIDSVKGDISQYLGKSVRQEAKWKYIQKSLQTFTYGAALYYLTSLYPYAKIGYEAMTSSPDKLEQVQNESFNSEEIKKELMQNWKEAFFELEGRYPDLSRPKDKAEFEAQQRSIYSLKDEDLRFNFKTINKKEDL